MGIAMWHVASRQSLMSPTAGSLPMRGVTVNHQDDCRAPLDPLRGDEDARNDGFHPRCKEEYNPSKEGTESRRWGGN